MSIVLVVNLTPNSESRSEVQEILEELIPRVHAEDEGCELYSLHEEGDDLVFIEKWVDEAALDAHRASEATREMSSRLNGKLSGTPSLRILTPIAVGDPRLGQV